ncbi:hypothetical protein [Sorangium sp. So ce341]|uniref:hypothetical protein n=1 Tax=Sorangium sp. So ce341 TaxID=3133302 RepID=UPI003F60FEF4
MPRRSTGSRFRNDAGRRYVRVLVGDKDRESSPLDRKLTAEQAERRKELVVDVAVRLRASRNVARGANVALLERAAVGEGRALRASSRRSTSSVGAGRRRRALRLEKNKTSGPRAWALSPGVPQALRARQALRGNPAPSAPLFVNEDGERVSVERAAERLRAHAQLAGIGRSELFEDSAERQQVHAHDTRSTFITVALANGRSETRVADRIGAGAPS